MMSYKITENQIVVFLLKNLLIISKYEKRLKLFKLFICTKSSQYP